MDALDRALLNIVQTDFPVTSRPYETLAGLTGTTEEEAWQRIQRFRQEGVIRRLGGVFDSHRLGYKSTLCAARVPEDKIQILADLLMELPGVTHNYLRNHEYNIWFTLIATSQKEVEKILTTIKGLIGTDEVYSLPALRLFKISVDFDFNAEEQAGEQRHSEECECSSDNPRGSQKLDPYPVNDVDKLLIRELQGNIPESLAPYAEIAAKLMWQEEKVLRQTRALVDNQVIRRFGAVLRHQKAGFTANAMGVWQVHEAEAEAIGKVMASFREVSHCYQRPMLKDWPYNLFTMIHGRSEAECGEVMARIAQATGIKDYAMLFSIKELKKSSMQYYREEDD
ncbi:AsnC family transcriptional regulator [Desulfitobacterium chlororespirans]|uniref:siroheme decarboxylase n=1 Tax=Desulfitobacterium chlororespirans DSM 11544 TaxID=1121395 RepID=A0A1M7U3Y6_9FIRM|nr:AsnC family transcriptional regulator [Desulfitobacterium chlororespirans]SHN77719.1 transcriptional regulator, AsnC family [Desulfitobacterium chlororespirans DSM 11544]